MAGVGAGVGPEATQPPPQEGGVTPQSAQQAAEAASATQGAGYKNEPYSVIGQTAVDQWTQRAQAAEPTREALEGEPTSFETFAEKPTNDYEALERYFERIKADVPPEQMEAMGRAMRERLKAAVGVKDTADLDPQARTFLKTWEDWLFGKIVK